jgi:hypothetical protein
MTNAVQPNPALSRLLLQVTLPAARLLHLNPSNLDPEAVAVVVIGSESDVSVAGRTTDPAAARVRW